MGDLTTGREGHTTSMKRERSKDRGRGPEQRSTRNAGLDANGLSSGASGGAANKLISAQ